MSGVTLEELEEIALDMADMANSSFPNRSILRTHINNGLARVHNVLAKCGYARKVNTFSSTAGTEEYSLPADFYIAHRVYRLVNGERVKTEWFEWQDLDDTRSTGPRSSDSFELWYAPRFERLTSPKQQVDPTLQPGWEMYGAYHAAAMLLGKSQEAQAQAYANERERLLQEIKEDSYPRDVRKQGRIEDVDGRFRRNWITEDGRIVRYRIEGRKLLLAEFDYIGVENG